MRLFIRTPAPSALKVQIYIDECDRNVETIRSTFLGSDAFSIADITGFLGISGFCCVPGRGSR